MGHVGHMVSSVMGQMGHGSQNVTNCQLWSLSLSWSSSSSSAVTQREGCRVTLGSITTFSITVA